MASSTPASRCHGPKNDSTTPNRPVPDNGEHWAYEQIQKGDTTCAANQDLHGEATNLLAEIKENATYNPSVADPLDPVTFVHNIKVPTFMACQWEDEQTGGHCADLAEHFTGTKRKWFTFTNGAHTDSLDPYTFDRLYDFLELFVAHQAPIYQRGDRACSRLRSSTTMALGVPTGDIVTLPPDPIQEQLTYAKALSAFKALPRGSGAVRQRRRNLADRRNDARQPLSRLRTVVLGVPDPRHDGSLVVSRGGRHTQRSSRRRPRGPTPTPRRERHAADGLLGQHGHRRAVGRRVAVGMELGAAHGRLGRVLRVGAAQQRHNRNRRQAPSTSG